MLSYYLMYDLIESLEQKYKDFIKSYDRLFFSANYINMLDYYNIFSPKENLYNLKESFENNKQQELLKLMIRNVKENKFEDKYILLLYGLIINKCINDNTKAYYNSLCSCDNSLKTKKKKQKLKRFIDLRLQVEFKDKNTYYNKELCTLSATDSDIDYIASLFTNVYKFSTTKKIIQSCNKNHVAFLTQNTNFLFFKKIYYNFLDSISKNKIALRPSLRSGIYHKKVDYLNVEKNTWLNPYTFSEENTSFLEIYDTILKDIIFRVDKLNEYIFYDKESKSILRSKEQVIVNNNFVNPIFSKLTKFKLHQ